MRIKFSNLAKLVETPLKLRVHIRCFRCRFFSSDNGFIQKRARLHRGLIYTYNGASCFNIEIITTTDHRRYHCAIRLSIKLYSWSPKMKNNWLTLSIGASIFQGDCIRLDLKLMSFRVSFLQEQCRQRGNGALPQQQSTLPRGADTSRTELPRQR